MDRSSTEGVLVKAPSLHCETTDMWLAYRAVCPFTSELSLLPIASTHGGMARLS